MHAKPRTRAPSLDRPSLPARVPRPVIVARPLHSGLVTRTLAWFPCVLAWFPRPLAEYLVPWLGSHLALAEYLVPWLGSLCHDLVSRALA